MHRFERHLAGVRKHEATRLDTGKGLQGAFEVAKGDASGALNVPIAEAVSLVEEQQDDHLVRADI